MQKLSARNLSVIDLRRKLDEAEFHFSLKTSKDALDRVSTKLERAQLVLVTVHPKTGSL